MAWTWLSEPEWRARESAHQARVEALTAGHRARREAGERHPVQDFLFEYYGQSPAKLRRWHPGPGVILEGAARTERRGWTHYTPVDPELTGPRRDAQPGNQPVTAGPQADGPEAGRSARYPAREAASHVTARPHPTDLTLDAHAFLAKRGGAVAFTRKLLTATLERPMQTGCFGLHEWAMVYRQPAERRHASWPLRLGPEGTDAVVESHQLRCTHFDAFRFFTPEAAPRNTLPLSRERQVDDEQPGCVHAGMDVYRWAFKLAPAVPSELVADAFELACELRELDMRASPYDLRELGYEPITIETPEGKRTYAALQRTLGEHANELRRRLLAAIDTLQAHAAAGDDPHHAPSKPALSTAGG